MLIENFTYKFGRYITKIKRVIKFIPFIWKFECWDYVYLLEYMEEGFKEFENYYSNPKNITVLESRRLSKLKTLKICRVLLNRLYTAEYDEKLFLKRPEYPKMVWEDIGKDFFKMHFVYKNEDHEKANELFIKKSKQIRKEREKQDLDLFSKIFTRHLYSWWD